MADQGVTAINAGLMLLRACTTDLDEKVEALETLAGAPVAEPFRRIVDQLRAVGHDIEVGQHVDAVNKAVNKWDPAFRLPARIVLATEHGHKVVDL